MYSCLELNSGVTPVVSIQNFILGKPTEKFGGAIFTRSDRDDINLISGTSCFDSVRVAINMILKERNAFPDIKDKVVEAISLSGLGAGQVQWKEIQDRGQNFFNDPAQVFSNNSLSRCAYDLSF